MIIEDDQVIQPTESSLGFDYDISPYISSSEERIQAYTIKKGDTISSIAKQFNISENTILFANSDIKGKSLKIGQTLVILPVDGVTYTVKKGDTLSSIALKYKVKASEVADFNNIDPKNLKVGDSLILPGGTIPKKVEAKPVEKIKNPANEAQLDKTQEISDKETSGGYIWPLPVGVGSISQRLHDGQSVDIRAPKGSPIYAMADGTVLVADAYGYNGGYGLYVVVNFDNGAQALYGHMSKVLSSAGQRVKQGDVIGLVGSTGHSTGNHIHLEMRGGYKNPFAYLPKGGVGY